MKAPDPRAAAAWMPVILAILIASPVAAQAQDTVALPADLPAELRQTRTGLATAFTELDAPAVAAVFASDGVVDIEGEEIRGRESIEMWFGDVFSTADQLRAGDATFVRREGVVVERFGYTIDGQEGAQSGLGEITWKRQEDGTWRIARLRIL